jgi:hypothetical protein
MKLVEVKLKYRSINKYKVLSHLLSYFSSEKGIIQGSREDPNATIVL